MNPSTQVQGTASQPVPVTPQQDRYLCGPSFITNAVFTSLPRAPQLAHPATSASVQTIVPQTGSTALFAPIIRGGDGTTAEGRLWLWDYMPLPGNARGIWSPYYYGAWTFTAGTQQAGLAGNLVLDTDTWCSNIATLSSTDRRGDYTAMWRIVQPASDDNAAVFLLADGLGGKLLEWELRVNTASAVMMTHRWVNGA